MVQSVTNPLDDMTNEALPRVEITPYDSSWVMLYQAEQRLLQAALSSMIRDIEHIGSTAIPHLQAKPIIDMMASTENLSEDQFSEKLALSNYELIKTGMQNRLLFRKTAEASGQVYHLHIVGVETWIGRKERIMRDYLIAHPTEAAAYGLLKEKLAAIYTEDSLAYTKAKTEFLQSIMDKACNKLGLPQIDVWTS